MGARTVGRDGHGQLHRCVQSHRSLDRLEHLRRVDRRVRQMVAPDRLYRPRLVLQRRPICRRRLYTKYSFNKHFTVHGTVLNLFDKPPPLDMQTYGGGGGASFDGAFHDAGAGASTVSVRPTLSNCAANFSPAHHGSVSELRSRNRTEHFSSLIRERRICPESVTETMYGPLQQWIRLLRAVRGDSQLCE